MNDRAALRHKLIQDRLNLPHRLELAEQLQSVLRVWLVRRPELTIGAYWPIKGEFDPLPALYRWSEAAPDRQSRKIGLPVVDKEHGTLRFHIWYPGCPMEEDAYGIPKPKDTATFEPQLLIVPCVGYGPFGLRLGYGGGFMDRTLAELQPRPATAGVGYAHGFLPMLKAEPHDVPLDAVLTEEGVVWDREG
ncbi:5-formyltetrahydrofolate cyclo-ligase [Paucibacter sp. DJ1R-11]|uniref:5-formyltetrahydrofolate cyclo-ligase n=1 Tax=Paucibacter sp. DJ1R-11 TaxID=2893556 RepID=UPI0021E3CF5E|nr:5-formyltetrahydrofolate cyclo-ligase [Paucibacter sp. DJ1R-11]MCV2362025.1 5-formyltetrahydrofolate cyclo-ligase [Paucibacter sp. DJ1R-11]